MRLALTLSPRGPGVCRATAPEKAPPPPYGTHLLYSQSLNTGLGLRRQGQREARPPAHPLLPEEQPWRVLASP